MDGVAISIIGRPRPLPGHDTPNPAHNTYTLKCEEPKIANDGDGNQIAQFGGDLNGTLNQINGTRTLASLTLPELG